MPMALDFRSIGFGFGPVTGKEQVLVGHVDFTLPVTRAQTFLTGFISEFDNGDHHIFAHNIITSVDHIEDSKVFVKVNYLLRDDSGNIDDPYSGAVHVAVIADTVPRKPPVVFVRAKKAARRKRSQR